MRDCKDCNHNAHLHEFFWDKEEGVKNGKCDKVGCDCEEFE